MYYYKDSAFRVGIQFKKDLFRADTLPTLLPLPVGLLELETRGICMSSHPQPQATTDASSQLLTEAEDSARTSPPKMTAPYSTDGTTAAFIFHLELCYL